MQFVRYRASSGFFGYELGSATGVGAMRGPPLFTRIDFAPSIAAPSNQVFATRIPSLRFCSSRSQMSRGALFDMWWHFVPVATCLLAIFSSHFLPDALEGSNSCMVRFLPSYSTVAAVYMLSSVKSPNSPENRSI